MNVFTIDTDNNITTHATAEEASQAGADLTQFDSQAALAKVSADWPLDRFVEIHNSIPGQPEVAKFADRKKAVARIWKAIQPLAASAQASQPEPVAETGPGKRKGARKAAKAAKPAKKTAAKKAPAKPAAGERSNKKADVIAMMKRAKGATLPEIMEATGWQKHTVRGFVSILGSKGGETIESSKNASGERTYRITK